MIQSRSQKSISIILLLQINIQLPALAISSRDHECNFFLQNIKSSTYKIHITFSPTNKHGSNFDCCKQATLFHFLRLILPETTRTLTNAIKIFQQLQTNIMPILQILIKSARSIDLDLFVFSNVCMDKSSSRITLLLIQPQHDLKDNH